MDDDEETGSQEQEAVDVEEAVFQETVDAQGHQEIIPKPKEKKTRGKRRKF